MEQVKHVDNDGEPIKVHGIEAAILHYCKYQERCHSEVRNKLFELGCNSRETEQHIGSMIEQGILNEERFAKAYAGGKFRMNHWGREKIRQQMKLRRISDYCIKKGLAEIKVDDYSRTLEKLTDRKLAELKSERNQFIKSGKVYKYLVQKGYERDLVMDIIHLKIKK